MRGVLEKMAGLIARGVSARAGLHKTAIPASERRTFRCFIDEIFTSEVDGGQWHNWGKAPYFVYSSAALENVFPHKLKAFYILADRPDVPSASFMGMPRDPSLRLKAAALGMTHSKIRVETIFTFAKETHTHAASSEIGRSRVRCDPA